MSLFSAAVLNEIVWRNFSTDTWVNFKVFGLTAINTIFALVSVVIITKYKINKEEDK